MKIDSSNIMKLSKEGRIDLLNKLVKGAIEFDKQSGNDDGAVEFMLFYLLDHLEDEDHCDDFGTEGWRHSILGE